MNTTPQIPNAVMMAGRLLAAGFAAFVMLFILAGPASAQYGGGGTQVFLDQVRVPVDQPFGVFGRDCPAGSTVEITIDGVPGILATTTASANGFYTASGIPLPDGLTAGTDYVVRATCGPNTATALMTLVCPSGDDPVGGQFQLLSRLQYEVPVYSQFIRWAVFTDQGTVQDEFGVDQWRVSVGTGIRLQIPFFGQAPIAIDFGFPILEEEGDESQLISFSIDLPFN